MSSERAVDELKVTKRPLLWGQKWLQKKDFSESAIYYSCSTTVCYVEQSWQKTDHWNMFHSNAKFINFLQPTKITFQDQFSLWSYHATRVRDKRKLNSMFLRHMNRMSEWYYAGLAVRSFVEFSFKMKVKRWFQIMLLWFILVSKNKLYVLYHFHCTLSQICNIWFGF